MIFIDSNLPMYLVGANHPHKHDAQRLLDGAISRRTRLITDAEVLQEILHRYHAIRRHDAIQPAFNALLGVVDDVVAVERSVVLRAEEIMVGQTEMSARDSVHIAAMESVGCRTIMSFDADFDRYPGIERLS